jgi:hypothetical protein
MKRTDSFRFTSGKSEGNNENSDADSGPQGLRLYYPDMTAEKGILGESMNVKREYNPC